MYSSTSSQSRFYMGVSGQLDNPAALLMRQEARYPLTRSLTGVGDLCERFGGERNVFLLSGFEPCFVDHAIHTLALFRTCFPGKL
jgi:hypothetical protein